MTIFGADTQSSRSERVRIYASEVSTPGLANLSRAGANGCSSDVFVCMLVCRLSGTETNGGGPRRTAIEAKCCHTNMQANAGKHRRTTPRDF